MSPSAARRQTSPKATSLASAHFEFAFSPCGTNVHYCIPFRTRRHQTDSPADRPADRPLRLLPLMYIVVVHRSNREPPRNPGGFRLTKGQRSNANGMSRPVACREQVIVVLSKYETHALT